MRTSTKALNLTFAFLFQMYRDNTTSSNLRQEIKRQAMLLSFVINRSHCEFLESGQFRLHGTKDDTHGHVHEIPVIRGGPVAMVNSFIRQQFIPAFTVRVIVCSLRRKPEVTGRECLQAWEPLICRLIGLQILIIQTTKCSVWSTRKVSVPQRRGISESPYSETEYSQKGAWEDNFLDRHHLVRCVFLINVHGLKYLSQQAFNSGKPRIRMKANLNCTYNLVGSEDLFKLPTQDMRYEVTKYQMHCQEECDGQRVNIALRY